MQIILMIDFTRVGIAMVQCETCWKETPKEDMCTYNGKPTCMKCAAKFIKHAFGRDKEDL